MLSDFQTQKPFCTVIMGISVCALPGTKVTLSMDFSLPAFRKMSFMSEFAFLAAMSSIPRFFCVDLWVVFDAPQRRLHSSGAEYSRILKHLLKTWVSFLKKKAIKSLQFIEHAVIPRYV